MGLRLLGGAWVGHVLATALRGLPGWSQGHAPIAFSPLYSVIASNWTFVTQTCPLPVKLMPNRMPTLSSGT